VELWLETRRFLMNMKFSRQKHNPLELIEAYWPGADVSHIAYDESMSSGSGDYDIIRQSGGDGTLSFTVQMIQEALLPVVNSHSFATNKVQKVDFEKPGKVQYRIGPMSHSQVFGMIYLGCSETQKYPGQRERVRMPVVSDFVYE
jgi:hypothetical protein